MSATRLRYCPRSHRSPLGRTVRSAKPRLCGSALDPPPLKDRIQLENPKAQYLSTAAETCAALDDLDEYRIAEGSSHDLVVLHGVAMYARDITRAASELLIAGRTLAASALTRTVIEHSVLAQWVKQDPETRGHLFLRQSEVERHRWLDVVLAADFEIPGTEPNEPGPKPKNVTREFDTVKNLFGDSENGRQLYLTYRNLSRFVHPSGSNLARYMSREKHGARLSPQLQSEQDAEAVAFYLASSLMMCALPYLDALGDAVDQASFLRATALNVGLLSQLA